MQHIGIVACSAEGAALCYREICRLGHDVVGPHDHPRITLDSIPLARWMPAFDAGDHEALAAVILESARVVAAAGADFAICPDNSAHVAWPQVESASPVPWLHIAHVVGDGGAARRLPSSRCARGTRVTMDGTVYAEAMGAIGIDVVVPDADDAADVDRIIFDELVPGIVTTGARRTYQGIIDRLGARGCDAVALACTEIPLLIGPDDASLPTLDSTRLLAAAALARAIG